LKPEKEDLKVEKPYDEDEEFRLVMEMAKAKHLL
jgi:hypothetical protein